MSKKPKPPVPVFSALADATRCRILDILQGGALPVHILAEAFSISRPAISRHLRVLKSAGLVSEVKKGRENLYAFKPQRLKPAQNWLDLMNATVEPTKPAGNADAPRPADVEVKVTKQRSTKREQRESPPPEAAVVPQKPTADQMGFDF